MVAFEDSGSEVVSFVGVGLGLGEVDDDLPVAFAFAAMPAVSSLDFALRCIPGEESYRRLGVVETVEVVLADFLFE